MLKLGLLSLVACAALVHAETGYDAWLRYSPLEGPALEQYRQAVPPVVAVLDRSPVAMSAQAEIVRGVKGMLGRTLRDESAIPHESAIVIGTVAELGSLIPAVTLPPDAFWLKSSTQGAQHFIVIAASNDRGLLYGAFALLRKITLGESLTNLDRRETPYAPVRWVNQWDHLNGTIERGYGGNSIFWENDHVRKDLARVRITRACWPRSASTPAPSIMSMPIRGC